MSDKILDQLVERQAAAPASPKAYSLVPDQNWDGNDGSWSTFIIQVGTPPQYFRVLPSVNGRETWVPIPKDCQQGKSWCANARGVEPFRNPSTAVTLSTLDAGFTCSANKSPMCDNCVSTEGHCRTGPCAGVYCCGGNPGSCNSAGCNGVSGLCTAAYIGCNCLGDDYDVLTNELKSPGAANPAASLGFQFNQSTTWKSLGNHTLQSSGNMSSAGNGMFGTDIIAVGPNPDVKLAAGQVSTIAGIEAEPYYIGLLGLRPLNNSRFDAASPSFLTLLRSQNLIPSLSFGYAAGAAYRFQGILGSLVLGGFDRSRSGTNATFDISEDDSYSLRAQIQSITASNTLIGDTTLLSRNITAVIDSDLPYLYLPNIVCTKFEIAFGLSWDASRELYLVNDTVHSKLRTENPTLQFGLGQSASETVNITLPYLAFDLQVTRPIAENGTNYFPLRCSSNATQYVLGRAFLQEAYLFVDYEKTSFSISQAQFNNNSDIVTVNHAGNGSTLPVMPVDSTENSLTHGAIAGIAIGSSVAVVLLLSFLFFLFRRSHRRNQDSIRDRATISAPIPIDESKDPWPTSPTSSGNSVPPMTSSATSESPIRRLEERLLRLERANTTLLPEYTPMWTDEHRPIGEFPGESAPTQGQPAVVERTYQRPEQELPGSPAARELQEAHVSKRAQPRPVKHVFELAADNQRRTRGKR
ncbi:MAG: hypothetical protein Q9170_003485 [Blastenia crenularia]